MKAKFAAAIVLPLALALSACGDTWGERALAGWPLLAPALVGAAVGAGIGAVTTNNK